MRNQRIYFIPTLLTSILFGIALPIALGVRGLRQVALFFTLVWLIYAVALLIFTFLLRPGLRIRVIQRKNPTIAIRIKRFETR